MTELVFIPDELALKVWPLVDKMIDQGIQASFKDRYTVGSIKQKVIEKEWHMWVVWEKKDKAPSAVFFTTIYIELSGIKVASITFFSGVNRKRWIHLLPELEKQLAEVGADKLEIWARKGWVKELSDYTLTHVLLEKDLDNGQVKTNDDRDTIGDGRPVQSSEASGRVSNPAS